MFNLWSGLMCLSLAIIVRVIGGPGDAVLVGWGFGFLNLGVWLGTLKRGTAPPPSPPPPPEAPVWPQLEREE